MKLKLIISLIISFLISINCLNQPDKTIQQEKSFLGDYIQISLSIMDLAASLDFYTKIGFEPIEIHKDDPKPWALLSDGTLLIMLSQNNFPSPALFYYSSNLKETILKLEKSGINIKDKSIDGSTPNSIILRDPNNFGISIIKFDTSTLPKLSGNPNRKCGIFGEFSIPVNDLKESIEFWEKLGYSVQKQIDKPYPQVILSDGLFIA